MVTAAQPSPARPGRQALTGPVRHRRREIRALRQRNGWTLAQLSQLMGCAAEGHRSGWQRRFARWEID